MSAMQLGLTIPLQRYLHIKCLPYGEPLDRLYCWDLHQITLHGRDSLLAVHCASRYTFVVFDMTATDWLDLSTVVQCGIGHSLLEVGLPEAAISSYLTQAGVPVYTKTHGRREVAFLNRAWDDVMAHDLTVDQRRQEQPLLEQTVNSLPMRRFAPIILGLNISNHGGDRPEVHLSHMLLHKINHDGGGIALAPQRIPNCTGADKTKIISIYRNRYNLLVFRHKYSNNYFFSCTDRL